LPTHVIKSRVGKLKTTAGKRKKIFSALHQNFLWLDRGTWTSTFSASKDNIGAQCPVIVADRSSSLSVSLCILQKTTRYQLKP